MRARVELREPEGLALIGDLRFATVTALRSPLERLIVTGGNRCAVDFSAVTSADSAALSLWLCCLREASRCDVELEARNVPEELLSIARLVGLSHLFSADPA